MEPCEQEQRSEGKQYHGWEDEPRFPRVVGL
jgi:hypothetical protein